MYSKIIQQTFILLHLIFIYLYLYSIVGEEMKNNLFSIIMVKN